MVTENSGCGRGFAVVCLGDLGIYSCHCSSNCTVDEFLAYLDGLADILVCCPLNLVIARYFNARPKTSGSGLDDRRCTLLLKFTAGHGL